MVDHHRVRQTGRQLADVLTKPLSRLCFTKLKKMIDMVEVLGLAAGLGKELLSNLLLSSERASGADVKRLPCRTVVIAGVDAKVSPAVTSSHCSNMAT